MKDNLLIDLERDLAKAQAELREYEYLTPMGSEFANNPKRCREWISSEMANRMRIIVKTEDECQTLLRAAVQTVKALSTMTTEEFSKGADREARLALVHAIRKATNNPNAFEEVI